MLPVPQVSGILASLGQAAFLWDLTADTIAWSDNAGAVFTDIPPEALGSGAGFVGRNDGRLTALDADNGKKLWEFQTGAGMNATASVFEQGGKQYVMAYSAGSVLAGTAKGDSVWLFALDGTLPPATG